MKDLLARLGLDADNSSTWAAASGWLPGKGTLASANPATGETIATISPTTAAEYDTVIAEARDVYLAWHDIPAPKRGEAVRLVGNALRKHKDALGSLVSLEMGKIKAEGDGEVQEMIDIADFAVGLSRQLYGKTMHSERPQHRMYEQWHPLGVVGVISAFNFPVAVWAWNAFIAAVCGNVTVWKPSPKTPLCGIAVQKICNDVLQEHGYPGIFSLFIDAGTELAERFVDDCRVDMVSFTGSCQIGRKVNERVAARMGRSLLELGGNNAMIVDASADLKLAVPAIVFGAVGTAGQRCTTTRRLLVHRSLLEELVPTLVSAYGQLRIGDPLDPKTLVGPLVDPVSITHYNRALDAVREAGGRILCGGEVIDRPGNFVEPTLVLAENDWEIVQDETFAPILYVIPFDSIEEAVALQNGVVQGLSSAIFTNDLRNAEYFLSASGSDCGIANVNIGTSGAEIGGAFGGEKDTGGGREAGSDSWRQYMRRQTNTINWGRELPLAQGIKFDL
ncbi:MAG: aldehyde dehydrogenase family protein [Xanthomonadaceae bacterium]|nr:aldehyde dehydrogenase family protein [Xanthomonadaceae bacterium]